MKSGITTESITTRYKCESALEIYFAKASSALVPPIHRRSQTKGKDQRRSEAEVRSVAKI